MPKQLPCPHCNSRDTEIIRAHVTYHRDAQGQLVAESAVYSVHCLGCGTDYAKEGPINGESAMGLPKESPQLLQ